MTAERVEKILKKMPILENRVNTKHIKVHSPTLLEIIPNSEELYIRSSAKNTVIVIYGAPGAGKDTLVDALIANHADLYGRPKTATTRKQRPNEVVDDHYVRMSDADFDLAQSLGSFIEVNEHVSEGARYRYGSLISEVQNIFAQDKIALLRIDPNGAKHMRELWKKNQTPFEDALVVNIGITPTHEEHLYERLVNRDISSGKSRDEALIRVEQRKTQIQKDLHFEDAHFILINRDGEIDKVVDAVRFLVSEHLPKSVQRASGV